MLRQGKGAGRTIRRRLAAVALAGAAAFLGSTAHAAPLQGKPDQVFYRNARGDVRVDSGTITENTLSETVIADADGDEKKRSSDVVVRIVFGRVPAAYADGDAYFQRADFENAAAKFRLVAGDDGASPVIRAASRLRAAETLMELAKTDATAFGEALSEVETFLADHADNRDVPHARTLQARATRMGGDAAAAAGLYKALFEEAGSGTPTEGYPLSVCYAAGVQAAECALESGDTDTAQALFDSITSSLPTVLGNLDEDDVERAPLRAAQSAARLGEGWILLAKEQHSQAVTFFRTQVQQVQNAPAGDAELRFGALLGLGESLLAAGEPREAQLQLAQVSSLDFSSRDRVARALVGLAAASLELPDANARAQAKGWVDTVLDRYADTPAVLAARALGL